MRLNSVVNIPRRKKFLGKIYMKTLQQNIKLDFENKNFSSIFTIIFSYSFYWEEK